DERHESKSAAKLLLSRLAEGAVEAGACLLAGTAAATTAGPGTEPGPVPGAASALPPRRPVHRLICFCRYFRWLTFRLDLPGLSKASLMLLDAESMKLSSSRVASRKSAASLLQPSRAPHEPSVAPPTPPGWTKHLSGTGGSAGGVWKPGRAGLPVAGAAAAASAKSEKLRAMMARLLSRHPSPRLSLGGRRRRRRGRAEGREGARLGRREEEGGG
uniref:Uncharacterized protein n=1 Tax=Pseudonaja textilis TaxID=8673 RepID=A0A670Y4S5_PSETE